MSSLNLKFKTSLENKLEERRKKGTYRSLKFPEKLIDFSSNDYLGFAQKRILEPYIAQALEEFKTPLSGSTGSRLISGNSILAEELENKIAEFHGNTAGLIFNSGYVANLGLFSALGTRHNTIIYDELCHASIRDGIRLGFAKSFSFKHNSAQDLEDKLKHAKGDVFVAVESLYSVDGDFAPLMDFAEICKRKGLALIVDEAHTLGVQGRNGEGLVSLLGLNDIVFAKLVTFGKALGCHGAVVLGDRILRDYLINFANSFIYSTALPPIDLVMIKGGYASLPLVSESRQTLQKHARLLYDYAKELDLPLLSDPHSQIQTILFPGNDQAKKASEFLATAGYNVKSLVAPTVPSGKERLRICLHAFNRCEEISGLIGALNEF